MTAVSPMVVLLLLLALAVAVMMGLVVAGRLPLHMEGPPARREGRSERRRRGRSRTIAEAPVSTISET